MHALITPMIANTQSHLTLPLVLLQPPPAISPTSGIRKRPSLAVMRPPGDVELPWDTVLAPTPKGEHVYIHRV